LSGSTVTVQVDAASPIAAVGGAAQVRSSAGLFLVTRTSADTFIALTALCTHAACDVIGISGQSFVCPCHGSRFSSTGAVLNGPATRALRQFSTRFSDNLLTINL
jgi:Rieske Fe-S protein